MPSGGGLRFPIAVAPFASVSSAAAENGFINNATRLRIARQVSQAVNGAFSQFLSQVAAARNQFQRTYPVTGTPEQREDAAFAFIDRVNNLVTTLDQRTQALLATSPLAGGLAASWHRLIADLRTALTDLNTGIAVTYAFNEPPFNPDPNGLPFSAANNRLFLNLVTQAANTARVGMQTNLALFAHNPFFPFV